MAALSSAALTDLTERESRWKQELFPWRKCATTVTAEPIPVGTVREIPSCTTHRVSWQDLLHVCGHHADGLLDLTLCTPPRYPLSTVVVTARGWPLIRQSHFPDPHRVSSLLAHDAGEQDIVHGEGHITEPLWIEFAFALSGCTAVPLERVPPPTPVSVPLEVLFTPMYSTVRVLHPESFTRKDIIAHVSPTTALIPSIVPVVTGSDFPDLTSSTHRSSSPVLRASDSMSSDHTPAVSPAAQVSTNPSPPPPPPPPPPAIPSETAQIHARLLRLRNNLPQSFPLGLRTEIEEVMHLCSPRRGGGGLPAAFTLEADKPK